MKSFCYLMFIAVLLASCSSALSADAIQTAIAQTQITKPTSTLLPAQTDTSTPLPPTPIPFADIDLSSILIQSGDLPAGYSGAQIRSTLPTGFNAPKPAYQIYQQLSKKDEESGSVVILVYGTLTETNNAYSTIGGDWADATSPSPVIGEKSTMQDINFYVQGSSTYTSLLFLRCNAVGFIQLINSTSIDNITSYARRLDERLTPLVCR